MGTCASMTGVVAASIHECEAAQLDTLHSKVASLTDENAELRGKIGELEARLNALDAGNVVKRVAELDAELQLREQQQQQQQQRLLANGRAKRASAKQSRQSSTLSHDSGLDSEADQLRSTSLSPHYSLEREKTSAECNGNDCNSESTLGNVNGNLRVGSLSSLSTLCEETTRAVGASVRTCDLTNQAEMPLPLPFSPRILPVKHECESESDRTFVFAQDGAKALLSARTETSSVTVQSSSSNILSDAEKQSAILHALNVVYD